MATKTVLLEPEVVTEIVSRIRPYLERSPINGVALKVEEDGIHQEEDWWYVPIMLDAVEPRTYEYYDLLIDIEEEIKERENIKVLLVPAN